MTANGFKDLLPRAAPFFFCTVEEDSVSLNVAWWARPRLALGHGLAASSTPRQEHRRHRRRLCRRRHARRSCLASSQTAAASTTAPRSPDTEWQYDYDVLIAGGGVVGAALGCKLAAAGTLRIGLVEARPPGPAEGALKKEVPDARVYALTPASKRLLDEIGVWDAVAQRTQPFDSVQVWEKRGIGAVRFHASDCGATELGYVAENNVLQSVLFNKLRELEALGKLDLHCPSHVEGLAPMKLYSAGTSPPWEVRIAVAAGGSASDSASDGKRTKGEQTVRARLLVATDGAKSRVRDLCGLKTWGWDYRQRAVVGTVKVEGPHTTAWQRFLPRGPVALLPLWDGYSSFVWSTTPSQARELTEELTEAEFVDRLNDALRSDPDLRLVTGADGFGALGRLPVVGVALGSAASAAQAVAAMAGLSDGGPQLPPRVIELKSLRFGFDLTLRQANSYIGPRVALAGDAAHTIHPMAGQGLNLGLADVGSLCEAVRAGHAAGADIGTADVLRRYDEDRRAKNLAFLGGLDALHRLFAEAPSFRSDAADAEAGASAEASADVDAAGTGTKGSELVVLGGMAATALARGAGMGVVNAVGPLRARLARIAMGLET